MKKEEIELEILKKKAAIYDIISEVEAAQGFIAEKQKIVAAINQEIAKLTEDLTKAE